MRGYSHGQVCYGTVLVPAPTGHLVWVHQSDPTHNTGSSYDKHDNHHLHDAQA